MEVMMLPIVKMMIVAVFFLGIFVEIKTGGMGAGILLAFAAAGVFFTGQYMEGLVDFYAIGAFVAGIVCIFLEILLPTVGILACVGFASMIYSLTLSLGGDLNALYALLGSFVIATIIFLLIVKHLPTSRLWGRLTLGDKETSDMGFVSAEDATKLIGMEGEVFTELRPAGTAMIDGRPIDVVSEGRFITRGTKVKVIKVHGNRVVVSDVL